MTTRAQFIGLMKSDLIRLVFELNTSHDHAAATIAQGAVELLGSLENELAEYGIDQEDFPTPC